MQFKASQLVQNIRSQADSLQCVLQQQCGDGLPALLEAARLLSSARRVLITGMGASMFASIALQYLLCSLQIDATVIEAGEYLHYQREAYRDAVIVIVSRSGESIEIAKLLKLLKGHQTIIGISNEPGSQLAREADVNLLIGSLADQMAAIQTYTGTVLNGYLLGCAVDQQLDRARAEVEAMLSDFSKLLSASIENIHEWDTFLEESSSVHLLARGPSCSSALEGALLFNEVAKMPAVGMPTASFRHGPVELVDREFRGIIFAQQGPTQHLNLALAQDLVRFGGQVRVIGPAEAQLSGLEWCKIPAISELLSPLFEIVHVQVAALRMAELRGIAPGTFRFAPQVATDEACFALR